MKKSAIEAGPDDGKSIFLVGDTCRILITGKDTGSVFEGGVIEKEGLF